MPRHVIVFDFGAVVFRWQPVELLRGALPEVAVDDVTALDWARRLFQSDEWRRFDCGTIEPDEVIARTAARTGLTDAQVAAVIDAIPDHLTVLPDTEALVTRLHAAGEPLYYLSNMPVLFADHLARHQPIVARFADGVFSGKVQQVKPDPAIFEFASKRYGYPPEALVLLDDSPANVAAARTAGWGAVLFREAAQAEAELRRQGWWPSAGD